VFLMPHLAAPSEPGGTARARPPSNLWARSSQQPRRQHASVPVVIWASRHGSWRAASRTGFAPNQGMGEMATTQTERCSSAIGEVNTQARSGALQRNGLRNDLAVLY